MIIKRRIIFDLENRKSKGSLISENVPLRIRLTYAGNRIDFSAGIRIDRNKWDSSMRRVKNNCTNKLKQSISEYKLTSSLKLARQTIHIAKKQLAKAQLISYSTKVGFAAKFKILSDIENKSSITKDFLKSIDSVPEEENNLGYPSFHEFIKYTETLDLYSDELYEKVEIQYHNWQDANWKNALGRPILDWKKLIKNKLPFFRNSVEK